MDGNRFDRLARVWAGDTTRRRAIQVVAGSTSGILLSRFGFTDGVARCTRVRRRCRDRDQCCHYKGQELACRTANSQNGCGTGKSHRCCVRVGDHCNDGCDCCGVDVICNGGFCDTA